MNAREVAFDRAATRADVKGARRRNPVGKLGGGGATPSMGLSQYRGGGDDSSVSDGSSDSDDEMKGGSLMLGQDGHGQRAVGAGRRKLGEAGHGRRKPAHEMGLLLSRLMHEKHGSGFWDDFKSGFNSVVAPVAGIAKGLLPMLGPEGMAASGVIGALGYGHHHESDLEGSGMITSALIAVLKEMIEHLARKGIKHVSNKAVNAIKSASKYVKSGVSSALGRKKNIMSSEEPAEGAMYGHGDHMEGAGFMDILKSLGPIAQKIAPIAKAVAPAVGNLVGHPNAGQTTANVLGALGFGKGRRGRRGGNISKSGAYEGGHHEPAHGEDENGEQLEGKGFLGDILGFIPGVGSLAKAIGLGKGKRKRAAAGPNDGRRKRAEIVKKVMREKGMKMIEASKYVKAHGLY